MVEFLLLDVDEAECVGGFFPEWTFTEGAGELEPWLEILMVSQVFIASPKGN